MNTSVVVHQISVSEIPMSEAKDWREDLLRRIKSGMRVVTVFGERHDQNVMITSVLQRPDHSLYVSRGTAAFGQGYHEITSTHPALHCFEREMHEQTKIRIAGHPWLKPIRNEGKQKAAMDKYPFYKIDGKEVHEVAVGPIHAGIIEPGSFRFMCSGEQILHLEIQLGYQHRGVERLLLSGDPRRLTQLVETIAGDSSVAHAWAYCAAIEMLAGCEPEIVTEFARAVALELERVAMHLSGLSGLAGDIGFLQGATTYGRLRTLAINSTMQLCGNRLGRGALRPGGSGMKLTPELFKFIHDAIKLLQKDLAIINDRFLNSQTVQHRLVGTGVVTRALAIELGLVGMAARASGVSHDTREQSGYGAYHVLPIAPAVLTSGDCWSRARIRIKEMDASLAWLKDALDRHPNWQATRKQIGPMKPSQFAVTLVEGWRGEVVHCLETDNAGGIAHYKVQDPSLRNWMGVAIAVRGNEISDFPICNKSFDLSYCGNDL
jgi:Ni,Fe-hydrogenase III large subunit